MTVLKSFAEFREVMNDVIREIIEDFEISESIKIYFLASGDLASDSKQNERYNLYVSFAERETRQLSFPKRTDSGVCTKYMGSGIITMQLFCPIVQDSYIKGLEFLGIVKNTFLQKQGTLQRRGAIWLTDITQEDGGIIGGRYICRMLTRFSYQYNIEDR